MIYLKSIDIRNLGGIDKFSAQFSDVSVVTGENGAAKSSFINSVATIFKGGADTELLKRGTTSGEVVIAFDNGYKAKKTIKSDGYTLSVTDPNGGVLKTGAATKVGEWVPKDGFDVRGLMRMVLEDPKGLTKFLLDHLPLTFTPEEVNGILGVKQVFKPLSLPELNSLRQAKYDERTGVNGSYRNLKGTIVSLEDANPPDEFQDWTAERDKIDAQMREVDAEIATIKADIQAEAEEQRAGKRAAVAKLIADLRAQIAAAEADLNLHLSKVDAAVSEAIPRETAVLTDKRTELVANRAASEQKAIQQQRSAGVQEQITRLRKEAEGHVSKETILTSMLEQFDKLKAAKLKALPVDGLDIITDGKQPVITINAVPLERINTQQQIYTAIKFISEAQKASGCEMRILVCEGAELDENHLVELGEACVDAGIQLVISMRVAGEPLQVVSLEEFRSRVAA